MLDATVGGGKASQMTQFELLDAIRDALAKIAEAVRRVLSSVAANVGQIKLSEGRSFMRRFSRIRNPIVSISACSLPTTIWKRTSPRAARAK